MHPMKHLLLFISMISMLLFGCMKSQIEDSLITSSHRYEATTITVLSNNQDDENFAGCLQSELIKVLPDLKIIPEYRFRNDLFPWFVCSQKPSEVVKKRIRVKTVKDQ